MERWILFTLGLAFLLAGCGGGSSAGNASANQSPAVGAIGDLSIDANSSGSADVTVTDDRTSVGDLRIEVVADNAALFPAGSLSVVGTGPNRSVSLTPTPDELGNSNIRVTVTDAAGLSDSTQFAVNVLPLTRNAVAFSRELAATSELGAPSFINVIEFIDDGEDDDFADLLSQ